MADEQNPPPNVDPEDQPGQHEKEPTGDDGEPVDYGPAPHHPRARPDSTPTADARITHQM